MRGKWKENPKAPRGLFADRVLHLPGLSPGTVITRDASGLENHGTLTNMDPATDCVYAPELGRYAIDLASNNQHCLFSSQIIPSQFSFFAWSKPRSLGGNNFGRLISNTRREVVNTTTNRVYLTVNGGTGGSVLSSADNSLNLNAWNSICATVSATGAATIRVNNAVATGSVTEEIAALSNATLGNIPGALTRGFDGLLADSIVFSRVLQGLEIEWLANPANRLYVPDTRRVVWFPSGGLKPWIRRQRMRMTGT